jgi:hypothetical protein
MKDNSFMFEMTYFIEPENYGLIQLTFSTLHNSQRVDTSS